MKRINIELSAQELDLALKLAKSAGYESIEEFIRFTLLRSDGTNHPSGDASQVAGSRDHMKRIDGELRRLRNELRGFLTESPLANDVSAISSASSRSQASTQLQLSLEIDSKKQQGAQVPPPNAEQLGTDFGSNTGQSPVQSIQLGYDRSAPGFKFNAEDELEDMAGAAFKNSPQLGVGSTSDAPPVPVPAPPIYLQSEEGYPIEELVDDDPPPPSEIVSASVAGIEPAETPVTRSYRGLDVEALFNGTAVSLADELVASASERIDTIAASDASEKLVETSAQALSKSAESAPVSIIRVSSEKKMPAGGDSNAGEVAAAPETDDKSKNDPRNASGESGSSESANTGQIKSPGVSGNLPPRKRKS